MQKIMAPEAWGAFGTNSTAVIVADIDTGTSLTHPDLISNLWTNPGETPNNGIDDDLNGYVDDVYGINAITGSGNPMDDHGHGTHTAGTIGAVGNNGQGVVGVNWNVTDSHLQVPQCSGQRLGRATLPSASTTSR